MPENKRLSERYVFIAPAQVIDAGNPSSILRTLVVELSKCGCLIETKTPFPQGTQVTIRLLHGNESFEALALVRHSTTNSMGVAFTTVEPNQEAILDAWLKTVAVLGTADLQIF